MIYRPVEMEEVVCASNDTGNTDERLFEIEFFSVVEWGLNRARHGLEGSAARKIIVVMDPKMARSRIRLVRKE